jgi:hypothetical protein
MRGTDDENGKIAEQVPAPFGLRRHFLVTFPPIHSSIRIVLIQHTLLQQDWNSTVLL